MDVVISNSFGCQKHFTFVCVCVCVCVCVRARARVRACLPCTWVKDSQNMPETITDKRNSVTELITVRCLKDLDKVVFDGCHQ